MNWSFFPALVAAGLVMSASGAFASGSVRMIPSAIPGAPEHRLPVSASQVADERMRGVIAERLAETLDLGSQDQDRDLDMQRLLELAAMEVPEDEPVNNSPLVLDAEYSGQEQNAQVATLVEMPGTEAIGNLSPEQIQAMAFLMMAMRDPAITGQLAGSVPPGAGYGASHDRTRDLTLDATGGSAGILLHGWDVAMRADGTTRLFQSENPGSEITLEPGLVIGALGPVTDIRRIGQEVFVSFENGDSISGTVDGMPSGIPPLPPLSQANLDDDVILLSQPTAMVSRGTHDPVEVTPAISVTQRPASRPESVENR